MADNSHDSNMYGWAGCFIMVDFTIVWEYVTLLRNVLCYAIVNGVWANRGHLGTKLYLKAYEYITQCIKK